MAPDIVGVELYADVFLAQQISVELDFRLQLSFCQRAAGGFIPAFRIAIHANSLAKCIPGIQIVSVLGFVEFLCVKFCALAF